MPYFLISFFLDMLDKGKLQNRSAIVVTDCKWPLVRSRPFAAICTILIYSFFTIIVSFIKKSLSNHLFNTFQYMIN